MWRYSLSFLVSAFTTTVVWRSLLSREGFWEEMALVGGAFIFVFWLGDGLFIRGLISDEDDVRRLRLLLTKKPRFASRLLIIGATCGSAAAILTLLALGVTASPLRFQPWSIIVLAIPIIVYTVVWLFLLRLAKSVLRGERMCAEPCAPPNGGPAAPVDNSEITEGRHR